VRTTGDTIALTPSFIIDQSQVGQMVDIIGDVIKALD
jgi:adenosylmethionine-8-amino-7-oxononanoate aminotransferase